MESRAHALLAGLFVVLLGAASVLSLWWFSGQREQNVVLDLVSLGSVTGLNVQAPVRYRGMAAGKVTEIRLDPEDPRQLLVRVRIRADLPLTYGTRASLGYQGVTGLAFVQLDDRGHDTRPLPLSEQAPPRIALESGLLDSLTDAMSDALRRFSALADRIGLFFSDAQLARFDGVLQQLDGATAGMNQTFKAAPEVLEAVRSAFSRENLEKLGNTLAQLDRSSAALEPTVDEARVLINSMTEAIARLERLAETTAGQIESQTLPEFNALLVELKRTTEQAARLMQEVERNPQVLFSGRARPAPGPGEPGWRPPTHAPSSD